MGTVIMNREKLKKAVNSLKKAGKKVVFTNGCYDLLHVGHIRLLQSARKKGDKLIVAINSDASVRRIKGDKRPLVNQKERAETLAALECIDIVTVFNEDDPFNIIKDIMPDILVKGGDWPLDKIIGSDIVIKNGGKVMNIKYQAGKSTTNLVGRVVKAYCG
ncbi:MAG TPA: D-glycero-beta-D-manno-heptose 1-phosphate adenylyltransferase [Candidatus Goldiibacteriota bacterium]|nr:D-glycero-beta-D-manno-heptose 1-phosphate adenylyltransferase [Candidatus Goldiibacteriota bacterium]HRQ44253.1 D-glycero-beta-D-manno-heptose 1-phosphate adenylyltransferase [Candidatus Goldiibacteriota bacterium]